MNSKLNSLGIYVTHALNGYEHHEKHIEKLFNNTGLNWQWVTDGDPSKFSEEILDEYFTKTMQKELSPGRLSCTLNHIYAYKKMMAQKDTYAVIFEDDIFFLRPFNKWIKKVLAEAAPLPPGFIISLENSTLKFPSYWQTNRKQLLYPASAGRAAGAYLIDHTFAKIALAELKVQKTDIVIDWWHNLLIDKGLVKMYWLHPAICEQGSHNGKLNSPLSPNSDNLKRRLSWNFQKWYKMYVRRLFNEKRIVQV